MILEAAAAALICLDPGHGTPAAVGRQTEPIGPGSHVMKIKDGGGASGEAQVALAIGLKTRTLLIRRGYRVAMTRTGPTFSYGSGGNIARAQFCNRRHAALMLRIHADGTSDTSRHGLSTLYPAFHRGWTDDIYTASLRAARIVQSSVVRATGATDLGLSPRSDLTGLLDRHGLADVRIETYMLLAPFAAPLGWGLADRVSLLERLPGLRNAGLLLLGSGVRS